LPVLMIYHEPGIKEEKKRILELQQLLGRQGVEAIPLSIEEALKTTSSMNPRAKRAYLLMFTRGGHWKSLVDRGFNVSIIPPLLTSMVIGREASSRWGRCRLTLIALRAKRLAAEQRRDVESIKRMLKPYCDTEAILIPNLDENIAESVNAEFTAPLALFDGKLARIACKIARKQCLEPFSHYAVRDLAAWIIGLEQST